MNWINTFCQAVSPRRRPVPHQSQGVQRSLSYEAPPRDFDEAVGYLAWYLKRLPDYRLHTWPNGTPCYVSLCQHFLMAWLRNELVDGKLPVSVRGEEWSL